MNEAPPLSLSLSIGDSVETGDSLGRVSDAGAALGGRAVRVGDEERAVGLLLDLGRRDAHAERDAVLEEVRLDLADALAVEAAEEDGPDQQPVASTNGQCPSYETYVFY